MWKRKGKGFSIGVIGSIKNYSRKIKKGIDLFKITWYINNRRCERNNKVIRK